MLVGPSGTGKTETALTLAETLFGDESSLIAINIRGAVERRADLQAQFEAARLIDRRVHELCERYGVETLFTAFEEQFNYSERVMLAELEQLPDMAGYLKLASSTTWRRVQVEC